MQPTLLQRLRDLLESAPDATVIIETEKIALINSRTEKPFGYTREQVVGRPIESPLPARFRDRHQPRRKTDIGNQRLRHMGAGAPLRASRNDGEEFPVEIILSPLKTEEGFL